ncbi:hypothetical protein BT96DRAFT_439985 [Gymnopus androsaceus JB14]|uniref:C3H1-type domain-containing protein n=1 Tax=Gymnopus androsaceus JB14 TaxID=1447944 RepID=A0A6A4I022_9AGAR|nr:hypothetical protein BT96DRAFT_439985 [Gymnopus androsaceus JB14]
MTVCSYFVRGQCRFGDKCRFEHPQSTNQSWVNSSSNNKSAVGLFTQDSITLDLTLGKEKPLWPLSSYGPAKNEPNVISGLDISSEELRFNAWEAKAKNDLNGYIQYEADRIGNADAAFNNARNNVQALHQQAVKQSSVLSAAPTTSAFGLLALQHPHHLRLEPLQAQAQVPLVITHHQRLVHQQRRRPHRHSANLQSWVQVQLLESQQRQYLEVRPLDRLLH